MRVGHRQIRRRKTSGMGDKRPSAVGHRAQPVVDVIQWATVKVFGVSLHDMAFGTTTMHINDYPEQLRLARTEALYLCRKHSGLAAATSAGFQPSIPDSYAVRSIERLLHRGTTIGRTAERSGA